MLLLISCICQAQDPAFSQFYNAKTYLNPATIGFEQGLSLAGNSRYQWIALDRGFVTHYAAIEKQEPSLIKKGAIGLAASVFQTTEGFSGYSRSGGSLTLNSIFGGDKTTVSGGFNLRNGLTPVNLCFQINSTLFLAMYCPPPFSLIT